MKLTIVMILTVLGLVSPTPDISMEVVNKLKGLGEESWNNLSKSLCYVSHMNMPAVHGRKHYGDYPIYPDGFRWAEIKLDTFLYQHQSIRSLRISNRVISKEQNELNHCTVPTNTEYLSQFYEIRYPVVYFGYFYQRKVVPNTSPEQQKEEEEYRNLLERYRTARNDLKFAKQEHYKPFNDWNFQSIAKAKDEILAEKEEKYEQAFQEFKAIQKELEKIQPTLLKDRYQVESKETPQLRLYFKDYKKSKANDDNRRTLALYIDNPTTEDLGLAMSVCKVAHACIEIDENIYQKLKLHNDAEEDKFFKESLKNQIKREKEYQIDWYYKELFNYRGNKNMHIDTNELRNVASNIWNPEENEYIKEEFLFERRLSRVFLHDFLSYGGKTDMIDAGIGAFIGFFSDTADSAIRNHYDDMFNEQKYKILDSNHLMLATIVGFGAKKELTGIGIRCNVLAYQEGFYRYLMKVIEDNLALIEPPLNEDAIINLSLGIVQAYDDEFMKRSGFGERIPSISDRIKGKSSYEITECEQYFEKSRINQQRNYEAPTHNKRFYYQPPTNNQPNNYRPPSYNQPPTNHQPNNYRPPSYNQPPINHQPNNYHPPSYNQPPINHQPNNYHQPSYKQYSFLEKRIKLRKHRLAKKLTLASIIEVFKAIKEFFVKVTAVVVATVNLVVHVVSTVIFGVIYAVSIAAEFAGIVLKVGMDHMIGETHISNIFFIPSQIINRVLGPIGRMTYQIKNATIDYAFIELIKNQLRKIWVQDELFYKEENVNSPITLDTYMMFSEKPQTLSKIFRMLLSN